MPFKQDIPGVITARWRLLLENLTNITATSVARILRTEDTDLRIHISQGKEADHFPESFRLAGADKDKLAETVIRTRAPYTIIHNHHTRTINGSVSTFRTYYGIPIFWPDGSLFGVLDLLNITPKTYPVLEQQLMAQVRDSLEDHLAMICAGQIDMASITAARFQAEEALRISEERFHLLVENAPDNFFLHDDKGRFLDVNERTCIDLGYTRDELLTMKVSDVSKDLTQEEKEDIWRNTQPGATARLTANHIRKDGSTFPVDIQISCHRIHGKKVFLGMVRDISERVENENALHKLNTELEQRVEERTHQFHQAMELLQSIMDNAVDAITLTDNEGQLLLINQAAETYLGKYSRQVLGKHSHKLFDDDHNRKIYVHEQEVLTSGQSSSIEETLRINDKDAIFLTTRSPRRDECGNITGLVSISRDITDRKIVENELRVQRERLDLATDAGHLGVWDYDFSRQDLICNHVWFKICGLESSILPDPIDYIYRHIHPDDLEDVISNLLSALKQHKPEINLNFRIVRPNNEIRWVSTAGRLIEENDISPRRLIGVMMDVTERLEAEEKLQRSYESLRQAERLARIGSWTLDLSTSQFNSSEMLYDMNGADPNGHPLTPQDLEKMMSPRDYQKVTQAIEHCIRTGDAYGIDVEHFHPDGTSFAAHIRGQAIKDADGRVYALSGTVQDISEREEARAQLAALADNVPNSAIFRFGLDDDNHYKFAYLSAGINRLSGISSEQIMQDKRIFLQIIHPDDLKQYLDTIDQSIRNIATFDHAFRIIKPDATIAWMSSRAVPRIKPDGRPEWNGIIRDITTERKAAEALNQAKADAEAAGLAKSEFLATMSHEIRTPLNTVIGMTRLMLQSELLEKQKNYLKKIDTSAKNLLGIINDILDFSKIEAGSMELENIDFSLESIFDAASNETAMRAEEKGLEIIYSIDKGVPQMLQGDPLRLSQILINLVSNAVKFTAQGEIVVTTTLEDQTLQFSVRDTGIGLNKAQIENLFTPFTQADSRTSRHYGGTGLGLSICKQLVEKMNGSIWVDSIPGQGATFHFTIAYRPASQPQKTNINSQHIAGKRILIVDDNASAREILTDIVSHFETIAHSVASAPEAIDLLHQASTQNEPYDVVLMDWKMPNMDGLEAARLIRADSRLKTIPAILMVTAFAREEVITQVKDLELQGLLIKPVTASMMFNALQQALVSTYRPCEKTTIASITRSLVPIKELLHGRRILIVDDNAFNLEVASDFLTMVDILVDTASSGPEAMACLHRHTYDAVLMDLHMPGMDGLETTRLIRQHSQWQSLPIIALTAQARLEDHNATLEAGMNTHLTKPIDEYLLYTTLIQLLTTHSEIPAPVPFTTDIADANHLPEHHHIGWLDKDNTLKRVGGDTERLVRLLKNFWREYADMPEQLETALYANDLDTMAFQAHKLRGAISYLAYPSLAERLNVIELGAQNGKMENTLIQALIHDLKILLNQITEHIHASSENLGAAPTEPVNIEEALSFIAILKPLLARGDYLALESLNHLQGISGMRVFSDSINNIHRLFEELDLDAASEQTEKLEMAITALIKDNRHGR